MAYLLLLIFNRGPALRSHRPIRVLSTKAGDILDDARNRIALRRSYKVETGNAYVGVSCRKLTTCVRTRDGERRWLVILGVLYNFVCGVRVDY